jgi:carboxypeptidase family protein/TonB-dependent receptor-like protein
MNRILVTLFASVFVFLVTVDDSYAQATAQITGTARDQSGAVLPGVEIHATQVDTGTVRDAITNETGSYVLTNLPIGPYKLEASLPGFRTYVQSGIVLQVNASPSVNVVLEVGQITEQVEVQANAALVETRTAGVGQVVENARILELPLNGRAVVELVALAGAAAPAPAADGSARDPFTKGNVSVAGGLNKGLNFTLDGAFHNNPQSNSYMSLPFPDALQEFKVETSASGAESGVKSSGSVSLVTKSGTNQFHGNAFEFVRNGMFNARNAFALRRDTIKRNQFGGTFGGPVLQNKLFFFAGYQGTTIRQDPSDLISFVPTAAMLAGDFTTFASPACNANRQITLKAPFVNNRVDPALFSKAAVNLASKLPKTSDPCGKVIYGNPSRENGHMAVGRIDYQRSSNHSIFGRYLLDSLRRPAPFDLNHNPLSSNGNNTPRDNALAQAFTIGDTYLFGANVVNSFRLTANRIAAGKFVPDSMATAGLGPADIGVKAYSDSPHMPRYSVTGGFSVSAFGGSTRTAVFAGSDDLSIIRGNHQFAIGASDALWWVNSYSTTYHANFAFNGQATGLGMADFFMGNVSTLVNGPTAPQNKRQQYLGVYGADTWKVNQRLTLSYGLRWEPFLPMVHLDGSAIHFDMDALKKGIRTTRFDNAPPGVFFPGDSGFQGGRAAMNSQWWNFSPRAGFAWDIAGDGRTSLRASYGQFYDFPNSHYYVGMTAAPPWMTRITVNDVNFDNPWSNYPGGDPYPMPNGRGVTRNVPWQSYGVVTAMDYDTPNMRVVQWNASLQKQIGSDWLASASYIGNGSRHLWSMQHLNPGIFLGLGPCTLNNVQYTTCSTTTNLDQRRLLSLENPQVGQKYGYIFHIDSGGTASYNGLLLSIQRRASRGVTVSANYTLSHCISDPAGDNVGISGTAGNSGYTKPDSRRFDRGNCTLAATDRRHLFNLSAVAQTPTFSNATLRAIGSGWSFSPIFRILSGGYLTVTTSTDRSLTGIFNQRLNQLLPDPYGNKTINNYLNPTAFALPALGAYGNVGSGSISGPGTWQFDAALSRTFRMGETEKLEFRAEAFNLTNSFRMDDPTTNFNSNIFGQVTSAKDPRIMQFALKYFF